MTDPVRTARRGHVVEITLDRPPVNALDAATSRALGDAFAAFRDDDDLRVAIITATGERVFSAGWDLKWVAEGEEAGSDYGVGGFAGLTEMFDLGKPVIAAVNGTAVGGGFELALACDLIVAADRAEFFLPETGLGIVADGGGVIRLPRRLPYHLAMELLLTGRRMSAGEAARWGLVNRVVPPAELMTAARALADKIAADAPLAVWATKEVIHETLHLSVPEAYARVKAGALPVHARMTASDDAREGPRAFAEKRKPRWTGR